MAGLVLPLPAMYLIAGVAGLNLGIFFTGSDLFPYLAGMLYAHIVIAVLLLFLKDFYTRRHVRLQWFMALTFWWWAFALASYFILV